MLDAQLAIIICLTFLINLIGSLAYSVRIAGVRTRRIALSFSLFNILVLVSRTANSFQAPMLAKRVEHNLHAGATPAALMDFRWLVAAASLATIVGAVLTPTFQRLFTGAVGAFASYRSVPRLLLATISESGARNIGASIALPASRNVSTLSRGSGLSVSVFAVNTAATAVWTVGVFAAIYAGYLEPSLRATSSNLSGVINGLATILLFVVVDPHLSMLTDDVAEGRVSEGHFRRTIVWLLSSRLAGTVLAQILLIPAAQFIVHVARVI